jgi:acetyltransferase-like isoleucine patch superfamily enzyme
MAEQTDGLYRDGPLPVGAKLGSDTIVTGGRAFARFFARHADALRVGIGCTLDGVTFAVGKSGRLVIGDHGYFTGCVLLCELDVRIGNRVMIAWNVTVSDTDFHPIDPELRIDDAEACSNISAGRQRPVIPCKPVVIEDDVYIGPNATILKGVRIGAGSWIEAGSLVTHDVAPRSRVIGNPARVVGEVMR